MKNTLCHIISLGVKEIIGLWRDPLLVFLIVYSFSVSIYLGAESEPDAIDHAAIAIVDEDVLTEDRQHSFLPYSGYAVKVGKIYNNRQFLHNENPGFVNPAHGDYTVKDGVDIKIPFEKIGQY